MVPPMRLNPGESMKHFFLVGLTLLLVSACSSKEDKRDAALLDADGDTASTADQRDSTTPTDTRDQQEPEVDNCHTDCFGGVGCTNGIVTEYVWGAGPCYGDWDEICAGATLLTCTSGACGPSDPRYGSCLEGFSSYFGVQAPENLLRLYCEEGRPKAEGDACLTDQDCRSSAQDPALRLICDDATSTCTPVPRPVLDSLGTHCGVAVPPTDAYSDQLVGGETCELCIIHQGAGEACISQACTARCEFDEDCPDGFICTCWPGDEQIEQVCVKRPDENRWSWRATTLSCSTVSCCGALDTHCERDLECCSGHCDNSSNLCTHCSPNKTACSNDLECCSRYCDPSGQCAPQLDGSPCEINEHCASEYCDLSTHTCSSCKAEGGKCWFGDECCSGNCDRVKRACGACSPNDQTCYVGTECCSGLCNLQTQRCAACLPSAVVGCGTDSDCCSGVCDLQTTRCAPCKSAGGTCTSGSECCSESCDADGTCDTLACNDYGTYCGQNSECCSNVCNPASHLCTLSSDGQNCTSNGECISGSCDLTGRCGTGMYACSSSGACSSDGYCCSGVCDSHTQTCLACAPEGTACSTDASCCTGRCSPAGICTVPQCN